MTKILSIVSVCAFLSVSTFEALAAEANIQASLAPAERVAPSTQGQRAAERAAPREPDRLGRSGQLIITSAAQLDFRRVERPLEDTDRVTIAPSADYLLTDHLTIGASLGVGVERGHYGEAVVLSAAPRIGYHVPIVASISVWPQLQPTFALLEGDAESTTDWYIGAAAPIVLELAPHFFVGVGPDFSYSESKFLSSGLSTMIGGWL